MEPERENANRLDAEVRGFVEELRLAQNARRDVPSQIPTLHPEDNVYYADDEPEVELTDAAPQTGRDQYARTPRFVDAASPYGKSPGQDRAPADAERTPPATRGAAPETKRLAKLRGLFGGKRSDKDAARTFEAEPLPRPQASPGERRAYIEAAAQAGYAIKPDELDAFLDRIDAVGEAGAIEDHLFIRRTGGEGVLADLLMRQKPQLVEAARFADRAAFDAQEPFIRQYAKDFNVTHVLADESRFNAAMTRVAEMAPLAPSAGFERFTEVRQALRDVGVRLTVQDFQQFKTEVRREWTADLMREDGAKSLGTKMLLDLTLPKESRQLVGSDAGRWDTVLRENQQFPELAARREELRRQAAPPNPELAKSYLPPVPPKMIRDGVERVVPAAYSQEGKILKIDAREREVWQATRAAAGPGQPVEAVRYGLGDILKAIPLDELKTAMEEGHNIHVSLKAGAFEVVDRDRAQSLQLGDRENAAEAVEIDR
jgi:hypothetical protein